MRGASRTIREFKTPISLLFGHASANLQLLLMLVIFNGSTIRASAQGTLHARDSEVRATMLPGSSMDSSQDEYADLKLSYPVRRLAGSVGLQPSTIFHVCWDLNFLLMMALIFWKAGPLLKEALQTRSRSIRRSIHEAQRLAEDAAKRLAEAEKRWAKLDSEIAALQAFAEVEMNHDVQIVRVRTEEDIHRIMEFSRSEIDRLAQSARHQLKAFAAGLAVSLARESIRIDKTTGRGVG